MQPNMNVNRPMQQQPGQQPNRFEQMHHTQDHAPRRSSLPWIILGIIVAAALVAGAILFRDNLGFGNEENVSEYQAVFLTNGQVYFGKLEGQSSRYVTLTDIYYLQVNEPLQQGQEQTQSTQQPQLSLVKLGNELHGPVDEMEINRDHILFIEDIKKDGRVATAIAEHKANPNAGAQTPPATQTPAAGTVPAGTPTNPNQDNSAR